MKKTNNDNNLFEFIKPRKTHKDGKMLKFFLIL